MVPKHTRLREARQAAGYKTATGAARALDVNIPTYVHHENGTRDFGLEAAELYAAKFGTTTSWLMLGEGDSPKAINGAEAVKEGFGFLRKIASASPQRSAIRDVLYPESFRHVSIPEVIASYTMEELEVERRDVFTRYATFNEKAYHPIAGRWGVPSYYAEELGLDPHNTIIVTILGDNLEPKFRKGDRVFISTQVDSMMEDAYYLISSSDGGMIVRFIETELFTKPQRLRVSTGPNASKHDLIDANDLIIVGLVTSRIGAI